MTSKALSEQAENRLRNLLGELRGQARIHLATAKTHPNPDTKAFFEDYSEDLLKNAQALHEALELLGLVALGETPRKVKE